jgi:hypothetical protein
MTTFHPLIFDREEITEEEKKLFLSDLKYVCGEYFDGAENFNLDVTKCEQGFSVCIIFEADRIKRFKKPR